MPDLIVTITPPGFATVFEDGLVRRPPAGLAAEPVLVLCGLRAAAADDATLTYRFGYYWQDEVLTRTGGRGGSLTLDGYGVANASVTYDCAARGR